jgi:sugar phosphate isomerase/epimerase
MSQLHRRHILKTVTAAALGLAAQTPSPPGKMRLGIILGISPEPDAAIRRVKELGFPTCQVSVSATDDQTAAKLRKALDQYGVEASAVVAGGAGPEIYNFYQGPQTIGLVPRATRAARIQRRKDVSDFAKKAGIPALMGHCGFIPEDPNDPLYKEVVDAIREAAGYCRNNGQKFNCETGQETPITLVRAIRDVGLDNVGVNFDVANLILYGKANPVDAVDILGPYIQGMHAKDGLYPTDPKSLGKEVPIGQGKVDFPAIFAKLKTLGYRNPVTIEREIRGEKQTADILAAKVYLEKLIA